MAKFNLRAAGTDTAYINYVGATLSYTQLDDNFRGLGNGNNAIYVESVLAKYDVTAFSDERLKTNIQTIDKPIEKVCALRGVTYEKDNKPGLGVIAQEVEKVLPEVVKTEEDEIGTKSVAYGNLVGLLIEAVKAQQEQLESQQKEINELKSLVVKEV